MPERAADPVESYLARFGLTAFRPGQGPVIATVVAGRDCLCVMPTGGGKSLCYQLPALVLNGLTLVVSPLIALMKDQVDQLTALGLPVSFINSTLPLAEQYARLEATAAGRYRLLYVVPERFRSARFLEAVRAADLKLLAVDEAHCISEWGHDFRPDYARLGHVRHLLGRPTTIALTATATDAVRRDIIEQLDLDQPRTFITGFARDNLHYAVRAPRGRGEKERMLIEFVRQTPGAGIIYTSTRKSAEAVAESVAGGTGRRATVYHAGLTGDVRRAAQEAFMDGRVEIVAATTAFGMGIDKRDVRFVVHYNLPGTLEAYYQEAGRAGRDGLPSRCLFLYSAADRYIQEYFIESAFPAPEIVRGVYEHLCRLTDDPIQLTQQEIKERMGLKIAAEGIGTCEQLLESAGVLERLVASQNMAAVRLDSELPTLVDLLPRRATTRRRVLQAVERLVGPRRNELVYFHPRGLAEPLGLDPAALGAALRELTGLTSFTYLPPFRGRAIRMLRRDVPFEQLDIDFAALDRRKAAEREKLQRIIDFARSRTCRQQEILHYFGEEDARPCGHCDNCDRSRGSRGRPTHLAAAAGSSVIAARSGDETPRTTTGRVPGEESADPRFTRLVRIALSGVARATGRMRCGKTLVAQMLCGSASERMKKLGMDQLSTFGLLGRLAQSDVIALLEGLVEAGYLVQEEVTPRRPTLRLTEEGTAVMKGDAALDTSVFLERDLRARLLRGVAAVEDRAAPPSKPETASQDGRAAVPETRPLAAKAPSSEPGPTVCPDAGSGELAPTGDHQPPHYWTWRLLLAGFDLAQAAAIRRLPAEVILEHALAAAESGWPVRAEQCLDAETIGRLAAALGEPLPADGQALDRRLGALPAPMRQPARLYAITRRWSDVPG